MVDRRLEPVRRSLRECGGCGERTPAIHDVSWRRVRDLPAFDRRVELRVARGAGGLPAVRPEARAAALARSVRSGNATSRRVGGAAVRGEGGAPRGALLRPGLKTVKRLDRQRLERTLGPVD